MFHPLWNNTFIMHFCSSQYGINFHYYQLLTEPQGQIQFYIFIATQNVKNESHHG